MVAADMHDLIHTMALVKAVSFTLLCGFVGVVFFSAKPDWRARIMTSLGLAGVIGTVVVFSIL